MSLEPSEFLENLKTIIIKQQETLSQNVKLMQESSKKLEENLALIKEKALSLTKTKDKLTEELHKSVSTSTDADDGNMAELKGEIDKINNEMQKKMNEIFEIEKQIEQVETMWNLSKSKLLSNLDKFQNIYLLPSFESIDQDIKLTTSNLNALNTELLTQNSAKMEFGQNPFPTISNVDTYEELFFGNSCGSVKEDDEGGDEGGDEEEMYFGRDERDEEEEMYFGKDEEEESDSDSESDTDSESDMEYVESDDSE